MGEQELMKVVIVCSHCGKECHQWMITENGLRCQHCHDEVEEDDG